MLCLPVLGPSVLEAQKQIEEASAVAHLLEFRLDLFTDCNIKALKELRDQISIPVIFTLRQQNHGGCYRGSEEERLKKILELAALSPTYLDLEEDIPSTFIEHLRQTFPQLKLIISYHHFLHTPSDLEHILYRMRCLPAHMYKIACMANSTLDSLRMLSFMRQHAPLLGMCMGEKGELTRVLATTMGAPWVFSYLHQKTAEGQLCAQHLRQIYHYDSLTTTSSIYGLIAERIETSLSHFTHNRVMHDFQLASVYVKITLAKEELSDFFILAKQLGIKGLSVTMPFKELVIPFLDELDHDAQCIGAVNTLVFQHNRLIGYNTDGIGALNAIEAKQSVYQQRITILGAGGAARAIIYEALKRGAKVRILNRTLEKALKLASEFGIEAGPLELAQDHAYDILINTTPHPMPVSASAIRPYSLVMDIKSRPKMTALLESAHEKMCSFVFGYEMFVNQAVEQYALWVPSLLDKKKVHKILQEEALKHL
ncbi:MAG: shikimate dehydrogenase [Verrucomicrobia bacterium]|nr:shikimate dehydrogenase [Verrucomicrobiota bacterium]MBS0646923.1 shikimate dehydrogenase [Verrucomicrobiota bacterium]